MKIKTVLAALSCAVAMACAGSASAQAFTNCNSALFDTGVVTGKTYELDHQCWRIGYVPYLNLQYGNVAAGSYRVTLNIDTSVVVGPVTPLLLEWVWGWQTDENGGLIPIEGEIDAPIRNFQTHPDGYSFDFDVGPGFYQDPLNYYTIGAAEAFDVNIKDYTSSTYRLSVAALPEPATWVMMSMGALAAGASLRSRRRPILS